MIIWLSSYPRSGNTFVRTLLKNCLGKDTYSIYNDSDIGGDPSLSKITGHRQLDHPFGSPNFDLSPLRLSEEIFFLKTHEIDRSLVEENDKVIYIIRNGYAATYSFHKYLRDFSAQDLSFLELLVGLEFPGGSWSDHVAGWKPREFADTLFLKFENVITHPEVALDQIAIFSGFELNDNSIPEFEQLNRINPKFFREGNKRPLEDKINEVERKFFWIVSAVEMQVYDYPVSLLPSETGLPEESVSLLRVGVRAWVLYMRGLNSQRQKRISSLSHIVELTEAREIELQNKLMVSDVALKAMQRSLSWRITRPLRLASGYIRKLL